MAGEAIGKMSCLFSIIIPAYNVEAYLRKCLDSMVNQTCPDWECICVDDGSPDNCGAILDEYKISFKGPQRFEVIHQKNSGVSAARNTALDIAQGQWVQFLDSDDSLKLDFFEKLSEDIKKHPEVDAIEHTAIYCYDDGQQVLGDKKLPPEMVLDADEILADPYGKKYTNLGRCSCYKIFKRSVIESQHLRFTTGMSLSEDALFAALFYSIAGKVAICPQTAGYLRILRDGSAMNTVTFEKLKPMIKGAEVLYEAWMKHPSRGMTIRVVAEFVNLGFLGKNYSQDIRTKCVDFLIHNNFYNRTVIPFIVLHGCTLKARIWALTYWLMPRLWRGKILAML